MIKFLMSVLICVLFSSSLYANDTNGSGNSSKISGESLNSNAGFLLFAPVLVSVTSVYSVVGSVKVLGDISGSMVVKRVDKGVKKTTVYGDSTELKTNKLMEVKFEVDNKTAVRADFKVGGAVKIHKTTMGALVSYEGKSLGFAPGTYENNNLKSEIIN